MSASLTLACHSYGSVVCAHWVSWVPHLRLSLPGLSVGFGPDPMSAAFGARPFAAGSGGHSDYFAPDGAALRAIALIALDRPSDQISGRTS